MALDYSVTNLLQSVRDVVNMGASQQDWPDAKLLRLLNRQVQEYLVPFIFAQSRDENWFVTYADTSLVANQAAYWVPSKATAMSIRAVHLVDSNGNAYAALREDQLEDVINYGSSWLTGALPSGVPVRYYFRGNQMVLFPAPSGTPAGLSLRMYYEARPSTLVLDASCVQITSFPGGAAAGFFRVGFTGTAPAGYAVNVSCDLVQNVPGFDVLFTGAIHAVSAGVYLEFTGTLPTNLAVGDWICLADTAPVVTGAIPEVVIGCLVDYVAIKATATKTDNEGFNRMMRLMKNDEANARTWFARRNRGDKKKAGALSLYKFRGRGGGLF